MLKTKNIFRTIIVSCIFCFFGISAFSQNIGKVLETRIIKSNILSRDVKYSAYLPSDYFTSERTYPVVYLLHGYGDNNTGWVQFGEVNRLADKAIADGTIPPMIIIMPDGAKSFYINSYDGKELYEDFFIKEFIPAIEKEYKIKAEKRYRGIVGLSMGGYGTLFYALKYPDLFTACAPLSAAVWGDSDFAAMQDAQYEQLVAPVFVRGLKGNDRLNKQWYDNSILKMIDAKSGDDLRKVKYWIDCGDDDFLTEGNCLLHIALKDKNLPHEFRVRDGTHGWSYWRSGIVGALKFIGDNFHKM